MKKTQTKQTAKGAHQYDAIKPLGNRVLIRPFTQDELVEKNSFGIILPDSNAKEKSEQGVVLAVGDGAYDDGKKIPMTVRVGNTVVFSKYGFDEITFGGEELYLIKEENILAIIN
jgi:chaperonin GroES